MSRLAPFAASLVYALDTITARFRPMRPREAMAWALLLAAFVMLVSNLVTMSQDADTIRDQQATINQQVSLNLARTGRIPCPDCGGL